MCQLFSKNKFYEKKLVPFIHLNQILFFLPNVRTFILVEPESYEFGWQRDDKVKLINLQICITIS